MATTTPDAAAPPAPTPTPPEPGDAVLAGEVAAVVAVPRAAEPDSFVLHAPLEVLARAALLPHVAPADRPAARARLAAVADRFAVAGPPVATGPAGRAPDEATDDLRAATGAGDADAADAAVQDLIAALGPQELAAATADVVLPSLGGAGHGVIALRSLLAHGGSVPGGAGLLRGPVRAVAGHPGAQVTWHRRRPAAGAHGSAADLQAALVAPPDPGDPGSTFVWPTVAAVEDGGLAADLLGDATRGLGVPEARRALLRVAAHAMLQDDPDHAPYGWTHALTLAQGALALAPWVARPEDAVAVAATYVLAFRARLGSARLDLGWAPPPPATLPRPDGLLALGPAAAAAAVWHAPPGVRAGLVTAVASAAGVGADAHQAKYVLSCLEAAAEDPPAARLFLAAAASLAGWWATAGAGT